MISLLAIGFVVAAIVVGWRRNKRLALILAIIGLILAWAGITGGS